MPWLASAFSRYSALPAIRSKSNDEMSSDGTRSFTYVMVLMKCQWDFGVNACVAQ